LCADLLGAFGPRRQRILDASTLLEDVSTLAWECAQWLQLPLPREALLARAGEVSQRNAKAVSAEYDAGRRAADVRMIETQFRGQLDAARRWFDRMLLPAMRHEALTVRGL
jgi:hypothetical protein